MDWIDEIVLGLKEAYLTNSPYDLCKLLKIRIEKVHCTHYILRGDKSIYFRDIFNEEVIYIRDDLYGKEEEFYLRHELGHAILHVNIPNSRHMNTLKLEKQANYFAFKLGGLKLDRTELYQMTLEQIASCLEVPYEPLRQLVNL
jgi:Zn-dependent peptidase ImmA (M78 family)